MHNVEAGKKCCDFFFSMMLGEILWNKSELEWNHTDLYAYITLILLDHRAYVFAYPSCQNFVQLNRWKSWKFIAIYLDT